MGKVWATPAASLSPTTPARRIAGVVFAFFAVLALVSLAGRDQATFNGKEELVSQFDPSSTLDLDSVELSSNTHNTIANDVDDADDADARGAKGAGPRDVLFIKVPKSGGTTLAVMLQRYARHFNLRVADPGKVCCCCYLG